MVWATRVQVMPIARNKVPAQHWMVRLIPVHTLSEALNLVHRFHEGKAFRLYVQNRLRIVVPAVLLMVAIAVASAAAFMVYATGISGWLVLPAILLMPVVLIGSLFVQTYVFFSWLENRAVSRTLGRGTKPPHGALAVWLSRNLGVDIGPAPAIPWLLVALFLVAPLVMMATFAAGLALAFLCFVLLLPIMYARLDR